MKFKRSALSVVAGALAAILTPPEPMLPSAWAKNLTVPDGPRKLERWDPSLTPYIAEPLDNTTVDVPVNEFCVMKSAQTGFTTLLLAAIGHTIDREPADMMVVQPTDGALTDFNSKKLQLAIDHTPSLAAKVAPQTARSGKASTTYEKRFGSYSLTLALASSTADLRSKSVQKALCDEVDEYAEDLDGQGSPFDMIEARQESFLKAGTWKRCYVSTPTIKGGSHIERFFEGSDQRRWHVPCPHCDGEFVFSWGENFRFERNFPHHSYYVAPCCGAIIEEHDRTDMVRRGRWIATAPGPGRMPGYHFDALSSPFVPWSKIAERYVKAGDDPAKLKTFYNLTLGLPFEIRGDAPDHVRLMERRETYQRGHIPPEALLLVASADVQLRGIYVEVLAIAPDKRSWVVDALMLEGDTADPEGGAFARLAEVYEQEYPDAFGNLRRVDAFGVDSGYRSHVVYMWVRGRPRAYALKGGEGWAKPAIGMPSLVDIDFKGRKIKKGASVRVVGTWPLKADHYEYLRKEGRKAGAEKDPPGYCYFGDWLDEVYFRQITSEYLADEKFRGRSRKIWKVRGQEENHFLDCRVYNLALIEMLGFSRMTPDDWAVLARERGVPEDLRRPDLFTPTPMRLAAATETSGPQASKLEAAREPSPASVKDRFSGFASRLNS